jgi:hypothetical protein
VNDEDWIVVKCHDEKCWLVAKCNCYEECVKYAMLDYGYKHRVEPICLSIVTAVPKNMSINDMLLYFYGIPPYPKMEQELRSANEMSDSDAHWRIGQTKNLLGE